MKYLVARDKNGSLYLYSTDKPLKRVQRNSESTEPDMWCLDDNTDDDPKETISLIDELNSYYLTLDNKLFPDLTWKDDPLEVTIIDKKSRTGLLQNIGKKELLDDDKLQEVLLDLFERLCQIKLRKD